MLLTFDKLLFFEGGPSAKFGCFLSNWVFLDTGITFGTSRTFFRCHRGQLDWVDFWSFWLCDKQGLDNLKPTFLHVRGQNRARCSDGAVHEIRFESQLFLAKTHFVLDLRLLHGKQIL